jgi:hypothetical protein
MKGWVNSAVATAALLPMSWAQAQISYSFLESDFTIHEVDSPLLSEEERAYGVNFEGSYAVMSYLHIFGRYQFSDFDDFDLQGHFVQAGVGTHYDFSATKSVYLNVSALTIEVELEDPLLGTLSADDDGYGVSIGYREVNHTPLEFGFSIDYVSLNDADTSDTTGNLNFQYELTERWKIIGGIEFGGDENIFRAGVRYYLPNRMSE